MSIFKITKNDKTMILDKTSGAKTDRRHMKTDQTVREETFGTSSNKWGSSKVTISKLNTGGLQLKSSSYQKNSSGLMVSPRFKRLADNSSGLKTISEKNELNAMGRSMNLDEEI